MEFNNKLQDEIKTFYLGDPTIFCMKALGLTPTHLVEKLGVLDFKRLRHQQKLGMFIQSRLGFKDVEFEHMSYDEFQIKYLLL